MPTIIGQRQLIVLPFCSPVYITVEKHAEMTALNHEIGRMLGAMIKNPEKFLLTAL